MKKKTNKVPDPRIWSEDKADREFSIFIRERDGRCLFPSCSKTEKLQCSHFIGRRNHATRFDPENCIALCYSHHYGNKLLGFEYQKQEKEKLGYDGQYTLFMKKYLGPKKYKALIQRGRSSMNKGVAIINLMELLSKTRKT